MTGICLAQSATGHVPDTNESISRPCGQGSPISREYEVENIPGVAMKHGRAVKCFSLPQLESRVSGPADRQGLAVRRELDCSHPFAGEDEGMQKLPRICLPQSGNCIATSSCKHTASRRKRN